MPKKSRKRGTVYKPKKVGKGRESVEDKGGEVIVDNDVSETEDNFRGDCDETNHSVSKKRKTSDDDCQTVDTPESTRKSTRTPKQKFIYEPDPNSLKSQAGKHKKYVIKCPDCLCRFTVANYATHKSKGADAVKTYDNRYKCTLCPCRPGTKDKPNTYRNKNSWHSHRKSCHEKAARKEAIIELEDGELVVLLRSGKKMAARLNIVSADLSVRDGDMYCVLGSQSIRISESGVKKYSEKCQKAADKILSEQHNVVRSTPNAPQVSLTDTGLELATLDHKPDAQHKQEGVANDTGLPEFENANISSEQCDTDRSTPALSLLGGHIIQDNIEIPVLQDEDNAIRIHKPKSKQRHENVITDMTLPVVDWDISTVVSEEERVTPPLPGTMESYLRQVPGVVLPPPHVTPDPKVPQTKTIYTSKNSAVPVVLIHGSPFQKTKETQSHQKTSTPQSESQQDLQRLTRCQMEIEALRQKQSALSNNSPLVTQSCTDTTLDDKAPCDSEVRSTLNTSQLARPEALLEQDDMAKTKAKQKRKSKAALPNIEIANTFSEQCDTDSNTQPLSLLGGHIIQDNDEIQLLQDQDCAMVTQKPKSQQRQENLIHNTSPSANNQDISTIVSEVRNTAALPVAYPSLHSNDTPGPRTIYTSSSLPQVVLIHGSVQNNIQTPLQQHATKVTPPPHQGLSTSPVEIQQSLVAKKFDAQGLTRCQLEIEALRQKQSALRNAPPTKTGMVVITQSRTDTTTKLDEGQSGGVTNAPNALPVIIVGRSAETTPTTRSGEREITPTTQRHSVARTPTLVMGQNSNMRPNTIVVITRTQSDRDSANTSTVSHTSNNLVTENERSQLVEDTEEPSIKEEIEEVVVLDDDPLMCDDK